MRRIDVVGIASEMEEDPAECDRLQNALSWRSDRIAAGEIEARLATHGFDQAATNVEVYVQAREIFMLFKSLVNSAQATRLLVLNRLCLTGAKRK